MPKISFLGAMEVVQKNFHGQTDRQEDKANYISENVKINKKKRLIIFFFWTKCKIDTDSKNV